MIESILPVLHPLRAAILEAWWRYKTFGLHPLHPDHGRIALRRAAIRGGVRV